MDKPAFPCRIGLHQWMYFPMALSFYQAFPGMHRLVRRKCVRCGLNQCSDDGMMWMVCL